MEQLSLFAREKRCSRCGETKDICEFRCRKTGPGRVGFTSRCIACLNAESNRRYYEQKQRWRLQARERRRGPDGDIIRARERAGRARNIEKVRERDRRRAKVTNVKRAAAKKAWADANRERINAQRRRIYAATDPEKRREKWQRDRMQNPEASRERVRRRRALKRTQAVGMITVALLRAKWEFWGGRCWLCGDEACEIDHVKPLARGGAHVLANLRPACRACNLSKGDRWPLAA